MEENERVILVRLYVEKAKEAMADAEFSFRNKRFSNCTNRLYYSLFYAISALFVKDSVPVSSHAGVKSKFGELYVKTGVFDASDAKVFSQMATLREKSDYNCYFKVTEDELNEKMPKANALIEKIMAVVN